MPGCVRSVSGIWGSGGRGSFVPRLLSPSGSGSTSSGRGSGSSPAKVSLVPARQGPAKLSLPRLRQLSTNATGSGSSPGPYPSLRSCFNLKLPIQVRQVTALLPVKSAQHAFSLVALHFAASWVPVLQRPGTQKARPAETHRPPFHGLQRFFPQAAVPLLHRGKENSLVSA